MSTSGHSAAILPAPDVGLANGWINNGPEGGTWWTFPLSVQGFFFNGGQRLYVKRVAATGAVASSGQLGRGCFAQITADAATRRHPVAGQPPVRVRRQWRPVTVIRGGDNVEILTTTIASYQSGASPSIVLAGPLAQEVRAGRGDVVRVGNAPTDPATAAGRALSLSAASPGGWGDGVQVRVTPVASATLPFLADPAEGALFVTRLAAEAVQDSPTLVVEATTGLSAGIATPLWVLAGHSRLRVDTVTEVPPAHAGDPVTQFTLTLAAGATHPRLGRRFPGPQGAPDQPGQHGQDVPGRGRLPAVRRRPGPGGRRHAADPAHRDRHRR